MRALLFHPFLDHYHHFSKPSHLTCVSFYPFLLSLACAGDNSPETVASRNAQLNVIVAARAAKVPRFLLVSIQ